MDRMKIFAIHVRKRINCFKKKKWEKDQQSNRELSKGYEYLMFRKKLRDEEMFYNFTH